MNSLYWRLVTDSQILHKFDEKLNLNFLFGFLDIVDF